MDDPYLDIIDEQWGTILMVYEQFKDKNLIIEYDVHDEKIYSYPAKQYIRALGSRTRKRTQIQYKEATSNNQFILFVKDTEGQRLRSYIFDIPE